MTAVDRPVGAEAGAQPRGTGTWFLLDSVVTGASAVMYLAGAGTFTGLLGASTSLQRGAGAFLLVFAAVVGWYAANRASGPGIGRVIVAVNFAWTAGSLIVAAGGLGDFTAVGRVWLVAQALVVGLFAVLQLRSLGSDRR